ncbi:MAG: ATP-binding cassette domain-containing protein, partial [Pseudomonadota bacterium]
MSGSKGRLTLSGLSVGASDSDRSFRLDIDHLEATAGDVIGLSGPSGTGKTMLLEVLGLLRRPQKADVFLFVAGGHEIDIAAMWRSDEASRLAPSLRGAHFGFVPQTGGLLPFLSVYENISLCQEIAGRPDAEWISRLQDMLGLKGLGALLPEALSIGQRQRVAIARALAHRPSFVIADEPTAALDPDNAMTALSLLIDAARNGEAAVIVSSHDVSLLDRFATRRVALGLAPS